MTRHAAAFQCNSADVLVTPSNAMRTVLTNRYGARRDVHVTPTGIDTQHFALGHGSGLGFRNKHGIVPGLLILLFEGRVAFEKNLGFLLSVLAEVVKAVPDAILVIAGDGPAHPYYQRYARSLGLRDNALFVGLLDYNTELLDCYRASDVFVFSSRTETGSGISGSDDNGYPGGVNGILRHS